MTPHDLIAAFEVLAEAPEGVKRLRELVLQLAVRGKLVPQDPGDEPASLLMKRIAQCRADLIASREIRRDSPVSAARKVDLDYPVPEHWLVSRVGHVAIVLDHFREPVKEEDRIARCAGKPESELYPYFGATRQQGWIDDYHLDGEFILLGEDGVPFLDAGRAKAYIVRGRVWVNNHAHVLQGICYSNLFLLHCLNTFDYSGRITGTTRAKLTKGDMVGIPIPVPPLAEQHRIVARVEELMGLLNRLEAARNARETTRAALRDAALAALQNADSPDEVEVAWQLIAEGMDDMFTDPADVKPLRQAVLQLAVRGKLVPQDPADEPASVLVERIAVEKARLVKEGKIRKSEPLPPIAKDEPPFELPPAWSWTRLGTVALTQTGATPNESLEVGAGNSIAYIKPAQLGALWSDCTHSVSRRAAEDTGRIAPAGTVLFVGIGGSIGKCGLVQVEATFNQQIHAATPIFCAPRYFEIALGSPGFQSATTALTSSTAIPIINKSRWEGIPVPLPPLAEQKRIVAKVDELMNLLDKLEQRLKSQRDLQDAFAAAAVHHLDA